MWDFIQYGERIALCDAQGRRMSYRQLVEEGEVLSQKIGKRCLVFSMCTNQVGSVLGYLSFLNHRIVPVLLNAHMDVELFQRLLDIYQPSFLWLPSEQVRKITDGQAVYETYGYALVKTEYQIEYTLFEELGLLLTTSGSTGSPKFVRQSYYNILSNANAIAKYLELDETERPITTLPMNYTYGLSIINSHVLVGAAVFLTDASLMQKEFWEFAKEAKATSFGGVPYTYEMLEKLRFFRMDLPDLRYMTQAGGKLSPGLHKKFAEYALEKGKKFIVMYGQCEATARMGYLPYDKSLEKYGSMGIAIPGGKFTLLDVDGKPVTEPYVTGELLYEGDNVTLGYAECGEDLSKGDERKGRLLTGDMAQFDKDGYYYIVGRKKRFLKVYGNRVNLDEIDTMLKMQFGNIECASGGVDDCVCIFVTESGKEEELLSFLAEKTKLNKVAFKVVQIAEIPKNDAGKVQYKELEKYYKIAEDSKQVK